MSGGVIAVIPARAGSKGLPGKNLRRVGGRPLITWSIEAALAAGQVDDVVVSTDDASIAAVARGFGARVPALRPAALAGDATPTIDVLLDLLPHLHEPDAVVLLQPTSPLRTAGDIDAALELWRESEVPVVSVAAADPPPAHMLRVTDGEVRFLPGFGPDDRPRQALPATWVLNGAIYIASAAWIQTHRSFVGPRTRLFEMPKSRSIDIDDADDVTMAEAFLARRSHARRAA